MARAMRSADELLAPAVAKTIARLDPADTDAGAVQLARRYAAVIDRAERAVLNAEDALTYVAEDDVMGRRHIYALTTKVNAQTVLAELGPKLLAVLEALAATPAARAKLKGGAGKGGPSKLHGLRATRGA